MKKIAFSLVAILVLVSIFTTACGGFKEYSDPGMPINTRMGEKFIIALEANPTTGYFWQTEYDETFLSEIGTTFKPFSDKEGSAGIERCEFLALKKGETKLTMVYKRAWEKDFIDKKTFEVIIK